MTLRCGAAGCGSPALLVQITADGPRCLNHDSKRLRAESVWTSWPLLDAAGRKRTVASPEDAMALASWTIEQLVRGRLPAGTAPGISALTAGWCAAYNARLWVEAKDLERELAAAPKSKEARVLAANLQKLIREIGGG